MSRRKKTDEGHENHERWLVSYADFITLLFAFFVMMYSISSVNEGKYRVLADSMLNAFQPESTDSGARSSSTTEKSVIQVGQTPKMLMPKPKVTPQEQKSLTPSKSASEKLKSKLENSMPKLVNKESIKFKSNTLWLDVEISSGALFESGSATLSKKAISILEPLTYELLTSTKPVYVLGYSDNIPIYTAKYSSNWELSAARAVSVVNLFTELGINPGQLAAIGYGEHRPVADNDTADGRAKNRRVVIRIFTGSDIFSAADDEQR